MIVSSINVTKRNGQQESVNLDKIHQVLSWASEGLQNVSISLVELRAQIQFYEGITTEAIQETLVKAAADLISEEAPDYQYLAARLNMFHLRKKAYGQFQPPSLKDHIKKMVALKMYDEHLLSDYTEEELDTLDGYIDHNRDMWLSYAAVKQMEGKYLVKNRATNQIYETPQFLYICVAASLFSLYEKDVRMDYVKRFYDATSTFKISLPTPIMGGVRTPSRQFSSCVLIEAGDSLDEINAASSAIVKYVSQRAGIGINAGMIRALGSSIRNGMAYHTGCIPFYKHFQTAVKSCSQGGIRGGAATLFYPIWHYEVESLLVLKNNRGVEENRVRHLDYGVQINKLMYERLIKNDNITLFSPSDVPGLYDAFFADQMLFEQLYKSYENDPSIKRKTVKAIELFTTLLQERASTGRIYVQNVDHCNTHSPFDPKVAPVRQSNLCVAPETQVLTDFGYTPIAELEGQEVPIWNGKEWSDVIVTKTGKNQKLLKVITSSGQELECTPYHKFYVFNGYDKPYVEKRANELVVGDKLEKFDLPVITSGAELENAYINGFYSGDGCITKQGQRVYLYHEKRELAHLFTGGSSWTVQEECNRQYKHYKNLKDKYFVPTAEYDVNSRLAWLAGWLDADGSVYRNGTNEALVGSSNRKEFLKEIQLMLQTLGVSAKICTGMPEGMQMLPANDGTGTDKEFLCKETWRLCITSYDTFRLLELGLKLNRLTISTRMPQRDAKQFNKIVSVTDEGRIDDTYCFTESKRHRGMFNGMLTGQCLEIALPTKPLQHIHDEDGEVALCTLAAFNLGKVETYELFELSDLIVRALDNLLDYQDYPLPAARKASMYRRTLGIGVINYANALAKRGFKYSDGSALQYTHELFEAIQYNLLKASMKLAAEKGACPGFHETMYAKGILPIDTYKASIDEFANFEYKQNWEALRKDIVQFGLRNSTLSALMPSETSSQISNATNGIEPPRGYISVKASKDGILKQVVPDIETLKGNYELLWQIPDNDGYLQLVGIMQKFVDQAISANTNYDPAKYPSGKVPMQVLIKDLLTAYKNGLKTLYYHNTRDGAGESTEDDNCASGACKI